MLRSAHFGLLAALGFVALALGDEAQDQCHQAYAQGCYAKTPFKSCCHEGLCQAGHDELKCTWGFEMPCCKDIFDTTYTNFIFDVGSESACQAACNALGDTSNNYLDYCPGGKLRGLVGRCPAALKSLEQAFGTKSWCSSHRVMTCDWTYSFYSKDAGKQLTTSASFNFQGSSDKCVTACEALGLGSNSPEWYCSNTSLSQTISDCPEAKASFDSAHGSWCKTGEMSLVEASGRHEIRSAVREFGPAAVRAPATNRSFRSSPALSALAEEEMVYDQECHDAFKAGCWQQKPFIDCCSDCASASFSHQCAWSFTYSSEPSIGGKLSAFKGEPWAGCDEACEVLGSTSNNPEDYCGDNRKKLKSQIEGCHQAVASLYKAKPTWCKGQTSLSEAMPSLPGQPRLRTVAATAVAAIAAMAAAALAVKLRARRLVGEEGYQPFLG